MSDSAEMIRQIKKFYKLNAVDVFSAMRRVPREEFVLPKYVNLAYSDKALPISCGQTISQPYTVCLMTHLLISGLKKRDRVLEIGTGSGYQAAILSHLFREVYTVEIIGKLAKEARKRLKRLGYKNIFVKKGNGEFGWEEAAPFDGIMVTAGLSKAVPPLLREQVRVGGRIIAPVGEGEDKVMLRLTKLKSGEFRKEKFGIFHFVPFVKQN